MAESSCNIFTWHGTSVLLQMCRAKLQLLTNNKTFPSFVQTNKLKKKLVKLLFKILYSNFTKFFQLHLPTFNYLKTYLSCMCPKRYLISHSHTNYLEFSGRLPSAKLESDSQWYLLIFHLIYYNTPSVSNFVFPIL